jgi:hypothetical protein
MPGYVRAGIVSTAGVIQFQYLDGEAPQLVPDVERWTLAWYRHPPGPVFGTPTGWQRIGFDYYVSEQASLKGVRIIAPWWALMVLLTTPVAWQMGAAIRRRRRRGQLGLCPHCGYDLRGVAGRCPECGEPAPAACVSPEPPPPTGAAE